MSIKRTVFKIFDVQANDTIRSGIHDFLLTFHSNHWPISHRFQDKRRVSSKIANFTPPRCILCLRWGIPMGIWYHRSESKII